MEKNTKNLNLSTVFLRLPPKELQRLIFYRLDLESLRAARCVSKLWKDLIDSILVFHLDLNDASKHFVESFGESRQVAYFSTTALHGPYPRKDLQLSTEFLGISVANLEGNRNFEDFRRRSKQDRENNVGLSYHNFLRVMHDFFYVSKLHIASLAVNSFTKPQQQILARVYLPNVKELVVSFFDGGFHQLLPFLRNYFPKLESVIILNAAESRKDRPLMYSWIFGFVGRHRKTLTELAVLFPEGMINNRENGAGGDHNLFPPFIEINIREDLQMDLKMPQHAYVGVKHRLENLTNLKKFNWKIGVLEGQGRYDLGTTLLIFQTMLVELYIDNIQLKDLQIWHQMHKVLEKISGTLETLSLGGCLCVPPSPLGVLFTFSCSWLQNCKRLKQLKMIICGVKVESMENLPFKNLRSLNLGHMLIQDQIEFVCRHGTSLEMWVVPQRGCLKNIWVAKITSYLFQCMLHLQKLKMLSVFLEGSNQKDIFEFVDDGSYRAREE